MCIRTFISNGGSDFSWRSEEESGWGRKWLIASARSSFVDAQKNEGTHLTK